MNQLLIVDRQFEVEKSFLFKKWLMRAICNAFFGPSMFFVQSRPIHITLTFIDISKLARWQLWNYFNVSSWNHILTEHKNLQVVFNVRCNWKIFLIYTLVPHFTDFISNAYGIAYNYICTVEQFNIRTVLFFRVNFWQFFAIFSKTI